MLFDPIFTLEQMISEKANKLLVHQTGQIWARHFPHKFQEIHGIISNYQFDEESAPTVAKTGDGTVDRGLTFTADMFEKKNLPGNVLPVRRPDNPFYSGDYKKPIPPVTVVPEKTFNTIQEAFTHYRVNKSKDLIKAMKGQGIKVFAGANEEQILELLNGQVIESTKQQDSDDNTSSEE